MTVGRDDDMLFEDAMANLDVDSELGRLNDEDARLMNRSGTKSVLVEASTGFNPSMQAQEDSEFLHAMGSLVDVPTDVVVSERTSPTAQPSRSRLVRRGEMVADVQIDLHGHTEAQAWEALHKCVLDARRSHKRVLLVICGQGLHSRKEAVLRAALQGWLRGPLREHVTDHAPAAPKQGGRGAWWLFLRR